MTKEEREIYMIDRYGEAVTPTVAAKILGISTKTVRRRIDAGELEDLCGGTMVCVHSIIKYMNKGKDETRCERIERKKGTRWAV